MLVALDLSLHGIRSSFSILVPTPHSLPSRLNSNSTCFRKVCHSPTNIVISFSFNLIFQAKPPIQTSTHCNITKYLISDFFRANVVFSNMDFWYLKDRKMYLFQVPTDLPTFDTGTQKYWYKMMEF